MAALRVSLNGNEVPSWFTEFNMFAELNDSDPLVVHG